MTSGVNSSMMSEKLSDEMTDYRPYSPEWNRKRYLREALDQYFNDYINTEIIYTDLMDILQERSEGAYAEFQKTTDLENKIRKK